MRLKNVRQQLLTVFLMLFAVCFPAFAGEVNSPVIIFVSFSMPDESLVAWMQEAQKIQAPVVVRGFIHNSFTETTAKVANLIKKTEKQKKLYGANAGIQVNPLLFRQYKIEKVPAVLVRDGDRFEVLYGNVTLQWALHKIADNADKNDGVAVSARNALSYLHSTGTG